ncbi:MAG TPA: hypothetical protein DEH78_30565, partial [Solibacterales bacterium]|nr:hypothetical protein [Bryobacterales bacterium]
MALPPSQPNLAGRCRRCGGREVSHDHRLCAVCLRSAALDSPGLAPAGSFGNYEPVAVLGEGGMGIVYLAEQTAPLQRTVALKVLKPGFATKAVVERFERERQSLARLDHPNIAAIFDAGANAEGLPFFVMEYVDGSAITAYSDERSLPIRERLSLFLQVLQALDHSHSRGIVHRDLKPGNILVTEQDGRPRAKVIDFGLARLQDWHTFGRAQLTGVAQIVGTPEYMSPEQAAGTEAAVDHRTDVYSLGLLLYEMLTGVLPFETSQWGEKGITEVLRVICESDTPEVVTRFSALGDDRAAIAGRRGCDPRTLTRVLSSDLGGIVAKAIEKDPSRRYATVGRMAADVDRYLHGEPVEARRSSPMRRLSRWMRRRRAPLATAAVAAALAATGGGVYFALRPAPALTVGSLIPFTAFEGFETSPSFSPDGKSLVYSWSGPTGENYDLYVAGSPGEPPRRLTKDPAQDVSPAWSPDGRQIAFLRGTAPTLSRLIILDVSSGEERDLAPMHAWYGPMTRNLSWSPDGKWLAVVDNPRGAGQGLIRLYAPATGEFRDVMIKPDRAEYLHPAFSHDGRTLAFTRDDIQSQMVMRLRLTPDYRPEGEPERVDQQGMFPAWLPNGKH